MKSTNDEQFQTMVIVILNTQWTGCVNLTCFLIVWEFSEWRIFSCWISNVKRNVKHPTFQWKETIIHHQNICLLTWKTTKKRKKNWCRLEKTSQNFSIHVYYCNDGSFCLRKYDFFNWKSSLFGDQNISNVLLDIQCNFFELQHRTQLTLNHDQCSVFQYFEYLLSLKKNIYHQ